MRLYSHDYKYRQLLLTPSVNIPMNLTLCSALKTFVRDGAELLLTPFTSLSRVCLKIM